MQAWIHHGRKENTLCKECLDVMELRFLELKLQVKWKLIHEAPSRKGEPCLKSFRGNQSPEIKRLLFLLYRYVCRNMSVNCTAVWPQSTGTEVPNLKESSPLHFIVYYRCAKGFEIRSPLKAKSFHLKAFQTFHSDCFEVSADYS